MIFVIGMPALHHNANQDPAVAFGNGTHRVAGGICKPDLSAEHTGIIKPRGIHKHILVIREYTLEIAHVCGRNDMAVTPEVAHEALIARRMARNKRDIVSGGIVLGFVQTVRVCEACVQSPDHMRFLRHERGKILLRAGYMLRQYI